MKIAIGCDHAGLTLKREIATLLMGMSVEIEDFGCRDVEAADYPDVAAGVANAIVDGKFDRGILICGTGIGMSIAANKVKGVRAALCHDTFSAHSSREHNDANVLCLGERVTGIGSALDIVRVWVEAGFSGDERHVRRVRKISALEGE